VPDRATIGNMAPGVWAYWLLPIDEELVSTCSDHDQSQGRCVPNYYTAQKMFGIPDGMPIQHRGGARSCLSGPCRRPKRPQDRIDLENVKKKVL